MKRILIAGVLGVFGLIMLPSMRDVMEEIADVVSAGMTGAKYGSFIVLIADNIFLVSIFVWIAAIVVILFWPRGERTDATIR